MVNVAIIEDEKPAIENLIAALSSIADDIQVSVCLSSVRESIAYFSSKPPVDLIFSDVQLGDGPSFEIFRKASILTPVIFITGYDEFIMNAFESNGIDYLLKPIDKHRLEKALVKYRMLSSHFSDHSSIQELAEFIGQRKKNRMLVKMGMINVSLLLSDIVLFHIEGKNVYALGRNGKKYLADRKLSELEQELDRRFFFRANRQYIINIDFIRGYLPFDKVKIKVELALPLMEPVIVSQEMAASFREWMHNA